MTPRTGASHCGIMIGPGELFNGEPFIEELSVEELSVEEPSSVGGLPLLLRVSAALARVARVEDPRLEASPRADLRRA
eukprot:scaffold51046_cov51-Phaeocystis_antarctica.AAC.1